MNTRLGAVNRSESKVKDETSNKLLDIRMEVEMSEADIKSEGKAPQERELHRRMEFSAIAHSEQYVIQLFLFY